jgi:hypothetical protein
MPTCKQCDRVIKSKLIVACTCGSFCSEKCQQDYHDEQEREYEFMKLEAE